MRSGRPRGVGPLFSSIEGYLRFKSNSLHHPVSQFSDLSENRSKSARVRAICDHAWTQRTPSAPEFAESSRTYPGAIWLFHRCRHCGKHFGKISPDGRPVERSMQASAELSDAAAVHSASVEGGRHQGFLYGWNIGYRRGRGRRCISPLAIFARHFEALSGYVNCRAAKLNSSRRLDYEACLRSFGCSAASSSFGKAVDLRSACAFSGCRYRKPRSG